MKITTAKCFQIIFNPYIKQIFVRWLAIYPTITLVLWGLELTLLDKLPIYIIALIVTLIVVPAVHYLMLPIVGRIAHPWIEMPRLKGAARHKMAFIFWCSTYPVITVLLYALLPRLQGSLPLPALTFCITVIAVPVINYLVLPSVLKIARSILAKTVKKFNL